MTRISKDRYYLDIAMKVAARSTCLKRQYGCVIVKNDEIIATGYNGAARGEPNCCEIYSVCPRLHKDHNSGDYSDCAAVHAEQNAMISASRQEMIGATLYLAGTETRPDGSCDPIRICEPCPICRRMINNAGISRVVGPQDLMNEENDKPYVFGAFLTKETDKAPTKHEWKTLADMIPPDILNLIPVSVTENGITAYGLFSQTVYSSIPGGLTALQVHLKALLARDASVNPTGIYYLDFDQHHISFWLKRP